MPRASRVLIGLKEFRSYAQTYIPALAYIYVYGHMLEIFILMWEIRYVDSENMPVAACLNFQSSGGNLLSLAEEYFCHLAN